MSQKISVVYDKHHTAHSPLTYPGPVGSEEYPEKPSRIESIYKALQSQSYVEFIKPETVPDNIIEKIHNAQYLAFLKNLSHKIPDDAYYYPTEVMYESTRPHTNFLAELGRFSFDLSAPVDKHIYKQALISANCAHTAALQIKNGAQYSYSLSRPPGHHAMRNKMGGFCYINNTAVAAQTLSKSGKVAVLDIDYHHGNGTQDIFYSRKDVFTVSIHADPKTDYPYYWGFADETGEGDGKGFNLNFPLSQQTSTNLYQKTLEQAVDSIHKFAPKYLVVAFGLDTYEKDPLGTFKLTTEYYNKIAMTIKQLKLPTVIIQEGGYFIEDLGKNATSFLSGFL